MYLISTSILLLILVCLVAGNKVDVESFTGGGRSVLPLPEGCATPPSLGFVTFSQGMSFMLGRLLPF